MSAVADAALPVTETPLRRSLAIFAENRLAVAATLVVLLVLLAAVLAPWLAPHDPYETDLFRRLQPPFWVAGGEMAFPLGCDALGRDILSRIIYGARISIFIGAAVILVATTIGIVAGLAAGRAPEFARLAVKFQRPLAVVHPHAPAVHQRDRGAAAGLQHRRAFDGGSDIVPVRRTGLAIA